jgi:hypothetical protein
MKPPFKVYLPTESTAYFARVIDAAGMTVFKWECDILEIQEQGSVRIIPVDERPYYSYALTHYFNDPINFITFEEFDAWFKAKYFEYLI